jgi:hypothetical protein
MLTCLRTLTFPILTFSDDISQSLLVQWLRRAGTQSRPSQTAKRLDQGDSSIDPRSRFRLDAIFLAMGDHRMTRMLRLCAGRGREGTSVRPHIRSVGSPIDTRGRTLFAVGYMLSIRHRFYLARDRSGASSNSKPATHALSPHLPKTSTMTSTSQPQTGRDVVLPTLDVLIQVLNIAKDACGIPPAQIALGSASTLLTMIRVCFPLHREDKPLTRIHSRTRWPTIRTTLTSGGIAGMYAKCSTGD